MIDEVIKQQKENFEKVITYYKEELNKIRTGRASVNLVEDISVDYYGSKSPLKQVSSISIPEARVILITPWSKDDLANIEKAINESQLNLNPLNDGQVIRINLPALNEERRRELVKVLNQKTEEARVVVRKVRETVLDKIQKMEKEGEISEDDKFSGKEKIQKVVDGYNQKIEEIREKKEEEIMIV